MPTTRRQDRQMAIHRAKEAYALWVQYGRKASGFCIVDVPGVPFGYEYYWQGWLIMLNERGKLTTTMFPAYRAG